MLIAIISDIHSNLYALENVLSEIHASGVDETYCLGDIIGYGPFPNECVSLVGRECPVVIQGNHDSGLVGKTPLSHFTRDGRDALTWTRKQISHENLEYLERRPLTAVVNNLTLAHASPFDPDSWPRILTMEEAQRAFWAFSTRLCFIGHTHIPTVIGEDLSVNAFRKDCRFLINVGSVGQPRDGDPRAAFGVLDTETLSYELKRVEYDVDATAKAIHEAGLPKDLGKRLRLGY
jgi:diadenosine tetraphosphatase ApaH/serine/threonine PP2A family protein phosphatase